MLTKTKSILIVDTDDISRMLFQIWLHGTCYQVMGTIRNKISIEELFLQTHYDILIVDTASIEGHQCANLSFFLPLDKVLFVNQDSPRYFTESVFSPVNLLSHPFERATLISALDNLTSACFG